jgi:gluconolactonase
MRPRFPIALIALASACGSQGAGGGSGAAGSTGAAGNSGAAGTSGAAGSAGGATSTGAAGSTGSAGGIGAAGNGTTSGAAGSAGAAGSTGGAGASGAAGAGGGAWRCPAGTFTAPTLAGLSPQRLPGIPPDDTFAQGFSIVEGPVWVDGALFVSQFGSASRPPPSRLIKEIPAGSASVLNADLGGNGMAVDAHGDLLVAVHKDGSIRRVTLSNPATSSVVAATYQGKRFNAPNDVTVRSDGTVYFSDPDGYQSPTPSPQTKTRVYRVSPAGDVSVVDETISQPNGVTLSLDEKTLFVSGGAGLFQFAVMPDGSTGGKAPFGNSAAFTGSDGMVMDCAGDLYVVANSNVVVLGPTGTELGRLTVTGAQAATNVAFGGADHKTLFITTLDAKPGIYALDLGVPGMPY